MIQILGSSRPDAERVLTPQALELVEQLHHHFDGRRRELLALRAERARTITAGKDFDFLPETADIRSGEWTVAPAGPGLDDRRVEITGPPERRMAVNALNSGAKVWLADLEDAITPSWDKLVDAQLTLHRAVHGDLDFTTEQGKEYRLGEELATIVARPRGWHLLEEHVLVDGTPVAGALFDFAIYLAANAERLLANGSGPYFYLPKLESHLEARLWNDVFTFAQERLGIAHGTIRATVLIETIPAAFEMEEILYELRDHAAGLNAGRWDYMFSLIKYYRDRGARFVLPDRNAVTMTVPFMRAYTTLLVQTCHRRGAHAIGGMSAFIPSRDADVNATALDKVRADKEREAGDGFDGSWVAHPGLVDICRSAFTTVLADRPHQKDVLPDGHVSAADLLAVDQTPGAVTDEGLRSNVSVALRYLRSWLGGVGAAAIDNLMEDAATAEIARAQVWQWVHSGTRTSSGEPITAEAVRTLVEEQVAALGPDFPPAARDVFLQIALADDFDDFLTTVAYPHVVEPSARADVAAGV
ncbi:malate synthase A [Desertihabitans brevis]|uniref:Malate synthase n=1 Tax=Desertihabitans brevis TaxID=2268447 RepID=A0A367YWA1_9ACTN|nr:malate synthase A [Desertihabitans brevis]RCK70173.1 malate synthase A [Desertihabitans brevis]